MAADQDDRGRPGLGSRAGAQPVQDRGGHHGDGEGHRPPDRQQALREGPPLPGGAGAESRHPAAAEPQPPGPAPGSPGRAARPCPAVPAHAQGAAHTEGLHGTCPARPRPHARRHPRRAAADAHRARHPHAAANAEERGQDLRPARARGGLHRQGQGAGALRVRCQGQRRHHSRRRLRGRHALHARQSL